MIRGYNVQHTARAIIGDEALKARIPAHTLEEIAIIAKAKPETWHPRSEVIRLFEIIDAASPDEATLYANLVRCGEAAAHQALSTFLKLLLKVLSPKQFASKFPDVWSHDHQGGYAEPGVITGTRMLITIRNVEGFSHAGPSAVGFIGVALRASGLKNLQIKDLTWSRANPGPRDVKMEAVWT